MAYTTHGYHISGTPTVDIIEQNNYSFGNLRSCGGIDGCRQCFDEYNAYIKEHPKPSEELATNLAAQGWLFTPIKEEYVPAEKADADYSHMVTVSAISKGEFQFNTIYNRFSGIAGELAKDSVYTAVSSSLLTDEGYEEESAREKITQAMIDGGYTMDTVSKALNVLDDPKAFGPCKQAHVVVSEDATTYFENILASYDVDRGVITKILQNLNGVGITISETEDFVR